MLHSPAPSRSYITHIRSMITSAHQISDEFHSLFTDGGRQHAYVALIASMHTGHETLASQQVAEALLEQVSTYRTWHAVLCSVVSQLFAARSIRVGVSSITHTLPCVV